VVFPERMSIAFSHVIRRGKILVTFASLEMLNKILMFVVGITMVRNMAKADYAWYTIANSTFGGMAMLSTLGVTIGLVSMGGERFGDRAAMGRLITTCFRYRKIFTMIFVPLVIGPMLLMLSRTGCPIAYTAMLATLVMGLLVLQINQDVAATVLRLAGRYSFPQCVDVGASIARVVLFGLLVHFAVLEVWNAILATLAIQAIGYFAFVRKSSLFYYEKRQSYDAVAGDKILHLTYQTLPETLSAFFMPQLVVLLISINGHTGAVAEFGAIGRLTLLFSIPIAIISSIVVPSLARSPRDKLATNYSYVVLAGLSTALGILLTVWLSTPLLSLLLGSSYSNLSVELLIATGSSSLGLVAGCVGSILTAKAYVKHMWVVTLSTILVTTIATTFIDFGSLRSVLLLQYPRFVPIFLFYAWRVSNLFKNL